MLNAFIMSCCGFLCIVILFYLNKKRAWKCYQHRQTLTDNLTIRVKQWLSNIIQPLPQGAYMATIENHTICTSEISSKIKVAKELLINQASVLVTSLDRLVELECNGSAACFTLLSRKNKLYHAKSHAFFRLMRRQGLNFSEDLIISSKTILFNDSVLSADDTDELFTFCNSFERLPTLLTLSSRIGKSEWLSLLGEHWENCDNIATHMDWLLKDNHFSCSKSNTIFEMMTDDEKAKYEALPDLIIIYRGCYKSNKWGLSWTLDENIAIKFTTLNRYKMLGQAILVKAVVKKSSVIALKLGRNELEVITYRPKHISTKNIHFPNISKSIKENFGGDNHGDY